jgi:phosphoglycolate phosphatase-like HAD superfamily hydrolase
VNVNLLVLWNIDLTLVDVARVTRAAHAEAFAKVVGKPLVQLPQMAGRSESEIFFDALALNDIDMSPASDELVQPFSAELARAMRVRRDQLVTQGQLMPGAADAMKAVQSYDKAVPSVLTGTSRANAELKLAAFNLDGFVDLEVGGYGDEVFPRGTLVQVIKQRAGAKYRTGFDEKNTVYIADSVRDVGAAELGGARSIAVATGRSSAAELREAGAGTVLADLTDAAALLRLLVNG